MRPFQYLMRYHYLPVIDERLGINTIAEIRNYRPLKSKEEKETTGAWGMPAKWASEHGKLLWNISTGLKLRKGQQVPSIFTLDDNKIGSNQVFYTGSLRRAYEGRASPDDMIDTVRLVVWSGMKKPFEAAQYMQDWFGQDCNAFVANYLGVAPYFSIASYAHGYGNSKTISGATPDVYAARSTIPLKPRTDFGAIAQGDVIATFGEADFTKTNRWRHIAILENFTPDGSPSGDQVKGTIGIAEWGQAGGIDKHRSFGNTVALKRGKLCPELTGNVIAFPSNMYGEGAIRIIFDASPLDKYDHRGFHVADTEGV